MMGRTELEPQVFTGLFALALSRNMEIANLPGGMPMSRLKSSIGPLAVFAAAAMLGACETPAKVSVLQSDSVLVRPGSTYAWAPVSEGTRSSADQRISNDIIQERLRSGVDSALAAKGYHKVDNPAGADLLVAYHVGLKDQTETRVDTFGGGGVGACGFRGCVGGWGLYGPPQVDVSNINYTEGTMILDLTDRSSGRLAWRATSTKRVDEKNAGSQQAINTILTDMTKSLPGPTVPAK